MTAAVIDKPAAATAGPEALRDAMRSFVSGVTVVTTPTRGGGMAGLTASSFTSVSLEPPLVLVCLSQRSRSYAALREARQLAIHILDDAQAGIARAFANQDVDRSTICGWRLSPRGNPVLDDCLAVLECSLHEIREAGDHAIVIARVEAIEKRARGSGPLVYHDGRLFALGAAAGRSG